MTLASVRILLGTLLTLVALPTAVQAQWFGKAPHLTTGEDIYRHVCQACHMPDGRGAKSPTVTAPALAKNPKLAVAAYPITVILNGKVAMPWFNGTLTAGQIAAVTNYIRTHFGNDFTDSVTEEDVNRFVRPAPSAER